MASSALWGSVKYRLKREPISSSRVCPVRDSVCWLTSVMMPQRVGGHDGVDVRLHEGPRVDLCSLQHLGQTDLVGHVLGR